MAKKNSAPPSEYGTSTTGTPAFSSNPGGGKGAAGGGKNVQPPSAYGGQQAQLGYEIGAPTGGLGEIGIGGAPSGHGPNYDAIKAGLMGGSPHQWTPSGTPWGKINAGPQIRSQQYFAQLNGQGNLPGHNHPAMQGMNRNVGGYERTVANHLANALRQQSVADDPNRLAPTGQGWQDYNQEQALLQAQQTNPNAIMFDPYNPVSYNNPNSLVWNGATGQYEPMNMNPTSRENMGI